MIAALTELVPDESLEYGESAGQPFVMVAPKAVLRVLNTLKQPLGYDFLVDFTAVDYPQRPARFELVYILYNFETNARFRVKTRIADGQLAESVISIYPAANWLEREVYDMFGIFFQGHPNLRRILMPEGWVGFPLRKDYSIIGQDQAWVRENLGIESGQ